MPKLLSTNRFLLLIPSRVAISFTTILICASMIQPVYGETADPLTYSSRHRDRRELKNAAKITQNRSQSAPKRDFRSTNTRQPSPVAPGLPANGGNGKPEVKGTIDISRVKTSSRDTEEMLTFDVLNVKEMDILTLFRIISEKSDLNIVVSPNVSGNVTVYLKKVEIFEALKSIIESYNLAFLRTGNIINIMTAEEYKTKYRSTFGQDFETRIIRLEDAKIADVVELLTQIKSSSGKVVADDKTSTLILTDEPHVLDEMEHIINWVDGMVVTEVFELTYTDAEDIASKITEELTPEIGSIRTDKRSSRIIVSDTAEKLTEIRRIIRAFDYKDEEVLIEAKIVQVTLSDDYKLGVDWEKLMVDKHNLNIVSDFDVLQSGDKRGQLSVGTLENDDYQFLVQALEEIGETNILSSPSIATVNNEEAKILVGSTEPYVTSTTTTPASGPTTTAEAVNFIEVGVKLYVTPTIHKDEFITMKVKPEISSVTRNLITSNNNSIPVVETSEAETTVTVKNGVTIFIGGLIREEVINSDSQVPVLGSIPLIGAAFRGVDEFTRKTEIVIFLTPKIITGDVPARNTYMARSEMGVISPEPSQFFQDSHAEEPIEPEYEYGRSDSNNIMTRTSSGYGGGSAEASSTRRRVQKNSTYRTNTSADSTSVSTRAAKSGSASVLGTIRRVNRNLTFVIIHANESATLTIGDDVGVYRDRELIAKLKVTKIRGRVSKRNFVSSLKYQRP